jgi:hypothetical protein
MTTAAATPSANGTVSRPSATPATPSPTAPNGAPPGRTTTGTFAPGNKIGRGNPHARHQAALRRALQDAVGPERIARIALALAQKAEGGDVAAAKLLFAYLLGQPVVATDPDWLDVEELKLLTATPEVSLLGGAADQVPPGLALEYLHDVQPKDCRGVSIAVVKARLEALQGLLARRGGVLGMRSALDTIHQQVEKVCGSSGSTPAEAAAPTGRVDGSR